MFHDTYLLLGWMNGPFVNLVVHMEQMGRYGGDTYTILYYNLL